MATTFIKHKKANKLSAVLPKKKYLKLIENAESLEDIRLYDVVKARKENSTSFNAFVKQCKLGKIQ